MTNLKYGLAALLLVFIVACQPNSTLVINASDDEKASRGAEKVIDQHNQQVFEQPNILWLVIEDMSPYLPDYGDHTITTPTISGLAAEGVKYTNVYSTSGVCAPSRAALALGMYPSSIGANHMRTTSNTQQTGLPKYEAVPPAQAKMLSQYMREQGYYTTNNLKNDYQFQAPKAAWHENGPYAHWRHRPAGQPFFAVFNFTTTHESGLFEPYGFRKVESRHYFSDDAERIAKLPQHHAIKSAENETPIHVPKDTEFSIPPYLPDTPIVRRDMWKMYNNLAETDKQIGAVLQQLKDDGLYDNTIIVFYSDHGGPLPRQKRLIYDSGLKVPMIIRFPNAQRAKTVDDQLISFVDFAPTTLALAGVTLPEHMQGRSFINNSTPQRDYIHAAADRFDEVTDTIRAVKDKRFKYIRNYRPEQGYYLPLGYREKIPTMQALLRLKAEGQLNEYQAQWFRTEKPEEELFDTLNDPHELHNLATNPKYQSHLITLRAEMDRWLADIGDTPAMPERRLINNLWQGQNSKPQTKMPHIEFTQGVVTIKNQTEGASIAYKLIKEGIEPTDWQLYQRPFKAAAGTQLKVISHRLGYKESAMLTHTLNNQALNNHNLK
ncbi:sulfatase-like hydrolase/transferase [Algibacillus agarilyticus]|uniref:sulfatase-like hydrolase/transferase n=1 Tax=Algibacillus agarilyticus TaxID=2234133 RepID=UPI000DD0723E|nr:sulfatase-like hydrolase/transferase [Algibacillus agarilyticus]